MVKKNNKSKINKTFLLIDEWVKSHGNGKYYPYNIQDKSETDYVLYEDYGIQQNEREIKEFIHHIQKLNIKKKFCLEIGLGVNGSTHILFRSIFKKTITIELLKDRVNNFKNLTKNFFKKFILDDGKSAFIFGDSNKASTAKKVADYLNNNKVDMLFLDGSHYFENIMLDWMIYKNFVKKGGIIAFHDIYNNNNNCGVLQLLKKLKYFENKINMKTIKYSKILGIGYYIVK